MGQDFSETAETLASILYNDKLWVFRKVEIKDTYGIINYKFECIVREEDALLEPATEYDYPISSSLDENKEASDNWLFTRPLVGRKIRKGDFIIVKRFLGTYNDENEWDQMAGIVGEHQIYQNHCEIKMTTKDYQKTFTLLKDLMSGN